MATGYGLISTVFSSIVLLCVSSVMRTVKIGSSHFVFSFKSVLASNMILYYLQYYRCKTHSII